MDSLLSIVQMPGGVPVATVAIGTAGAKNTGLLAAQILVHLIGFSRKIGIYRYEMRKAALRK